MPLTPRNRRAVVVIAALAALTVLALAATSGAPSLITEVARPGELAFPLPSQRPPAATPAAQSGLPLPTGTPRSGLQLGPWAVRALLIAEVLAVAAITVLAVRAFRARRLPEAAEAAEASATGPLADVVEQDVREALGLSLAGLRHGDDAGETILQCWRRLEEVAARHGAARRASQTAEEYTLALLRRTALDPADLRALADLYRAALFAEVPPGEDGRRRAVDLLERLLATLDGGEGASGGDARP